MIQRLVAWCREKLGLCPYCRGGTGTYKEYWRTWEDWRVGKKAPTVTYTCFYCEGTGKLKRES